MWCERSSLRDVLDAVYCSAGWAVFVADTAILGLGAIGLCARDDSGDLGFRLYHLWGKLNLRLLGASLEVRGLERLAPDQPYVLMVNHQSFLDAWAIAATIPVKARGLVQHELRSVPIAGQACERLGHIFVDRGDPWAAHESLRRAAERAAAGTSLLFFPEGTRTRNGRLGPFKTGGFHLAIRSGVPVLPVSVWGTGALLPPDEWRFKPGPVHVAIGRPIPTEHLDPGDLRPLMRRTRQAIIDGLPPEAGRYGSPDVEQGQHFGRSPGRQEG